MTNQTGPETIPAELRRAGLAAAEYPIEKQDAIWIRRSNDKPDIARQTGRLLAALFARPGAQRKLRILSLGCGMEPQLNLFQAHGEEIYLADIDRASLDAVRRSPALCFADNIHLIEQDFTALREETAAAAFCREKLGGPVDAIFFHHSLYYLPQRDWLALLGNLYDYALKPGGGLHAALMSSRCADPHSTTWLYNHFAGAFCQHTNDQDLLAFAEELRKEPVLEDAEIETATSRVLFGSEDFAELMAVLWMILLYPQVHRYTQAQQEEITAHVYREFFAPGRNLLQEQDHLFLFKPL